MNNIIEPNDSFDFSKLSLGHPNGIQGGAYFTKLLYNSSPLYIQTTKSLTRQGFIKSGKKYYCDLMFDNNSEILIRWFENLEESCQSLIFEKSEAWFQNSLDKNDVESAFNSVIRIYKSGKYYLLRTNVKNNINNEPSIKIYNENELPLTINDITSETNLISILEIQGIKFTSRNFQIEIELKQSMVIDNEPIFDECLIKTQKKTSDIKKHIENTLETNSLNNENKLNFDIPIENRDDADGVDDDKTISVSDIVDDDMNNSSLNDIQNVNSENNIDNDNLDVQATTLADVDENNIEINFDIEDLNKVEDSNKEYLKEIDFNIALEENTLETLTLKKPNQVYFELYKEAREKAKLAKKAAIIAYLEAKNIKKTFMIDTIENYDQSDIDAEIDAEIDEVSESELEEI
jgi:hypothetical protein